MSIAFPVFLLLAGILGLRKSCSGHSSLLIVVLLALLIRLLFAALNILEIRFPYSDTTDVNAFLSFAEGMDGGGSEFDISSSYVWAALIGVINLYTGDMVFSPLVINALAGSYTIVLGYRIADILFCDARRGLRVAMVLAVLPPLIFMSATYLRDATTILSFTAYAYHLLCFGLNRHPKLTSLLATMFWGVLAALLHGAFAVLPVFAFAYMLAKSASDRITSRSLGIYAITVAVLIALAFGYSYFGVGASKVGALYASSTDLIMERIIRTASGGMMAEDTYVLATAPVLFLPLAITKFLFSPFFADQLRSFDLVRYPIVILLGISMLGVLARAFPYPFTRIRISFSVLSVLLLAYFVLFAIGSLDPDTAFRHYIKFMPVLIAAGMPLGRPRTRPEYPLDSAAFASGISR